RVRILDFGLAAAEAERGRLTQKGLLLGTPQYMAPEQVCSESIDGRADLFGLGCVLYECLTGQRPFDGPHVLAILSALANRQPQPPHELSPEVPRELSALVMRLLEKSAARRPATAADVVQALARLDVTAPQRKPPRRWWRRAAVAVGSAAVLLAGGVIIYRGV